MCLLKSGSGRSRASFRAGARSHSTARRVYHGLARAIVRSTVDRATPIDHRMRRQLIDIDGAPTVAVNDSGAGELVLTASAVGLASAVLRIPLTTDLGELPLAVAARSV